MHGEGRDLFVSESLTKLGDHDVSVTASPHHVSEPARISTKSKVDG